MVVGLFAVSMLSAVSWRLKNRADANANEARRHLYEASMSFTQSYWESGRYTSVVDLLQRTKPQANDEDLRGFEWYYWDRLAHSHLLSLEGTTRDIRDLTFSPDGKHLASVDDGGTVKFWDAITGRELFTPTIPSTLYIPEVRFSEDGRRLVCVSRSEAATFANVWNVELGQQLFTLEVGGSKNVFIQHNERLVVITLDDAVEVWDVPTKKKILAVTGAVSTGKSFALCPNGERLATTDEDSVTVWDIATGLPMFTLNMTVRHLEFSPDGKRLISEHAGEITAWDVSNARSLFTLKAGDILSLAFSQDGTRMAAKTGEGIIKVWDTSGGQERLSLNSAVDRFSGLSFSPKGNWLIHSAADGATTAWNTSNGQKLITLEYMKIAPAGYLFSPDDRRLALLGRHNSLNVFDVLNKRMLLEVKNGFETFLFSPDGRRLAVACKNRIQVWDSSCEQNTLTFKEHAAIGHMTFSTDGNRLALADHDSSLMVWDTVRGQRTLSWEMLNWFSGEVALSPDGKRLARCGWRGVAIWDTTSVRRTLALEDNSVVTSLEFGHNVVLQPKCDSRQVSKVGLP